MYQSIWIVVRERLNERRIDEAEDGGTRGDPKCQHQHGGKCKSRVAQQLSKREPNVLEETLEEGNRVLRAVRLPHCLHPTQLDHRVPARLFRRHPRPQVVVDVHLAMALDLRREILAFVIATKEPSKPQYPRSQLLHPISSCVKKRATIAVVCSQSFASFSICLLPARVKR